MLRSCSECAIRRNRIHWPFSHESYQTSKCHHKLGILSMLHQKISVHGVRFWTKRECLMSVTWLTRFRYNKNSAENSYLFARLILHNFQEVCLYMLPCIMSCCGRAAGLSISLPLWWSLACNRRKLAYCSCALRNFEPMLLLSCAHVTAFR